MNHMRMFLLLLGASLILFPFQNCAPTHLEGVNEGFSQNSVDDDDDFDINNYTEEEIADAFEKSLHPTVTTYCGVCHGATQNPKFAVSDALAGSNTIMLNKLVNLSNPGGSKMVNKIRGGHNGFSTAVADEIQEKIEQWAEELVAL